MQASNVAYIDPSDHQYLYPVQKKVLRKTESRGSLVSATSASSANARFNPNARKSIFVDSKDQSNGAAPIQILSKVNLEGVSRYNQAQSVAGKVFWMLLAILFMAMLIRGLIQNVYDYMNSPIATTFTIKTPSDLEFPDVYICMGNAFSRSYLMKHPGLLSDTSVFASLVSNKRKKRNADEAEQELMNDHVLENLEILSSLNEGDLSERFRRDVNSSNSAAFDLYKVVNEAGFPVDTTFLKCMFHGHEDVSFNCSQIIKPIIDPNYYLCYLLHIPTEYRQVKARKGLSLIIDSQRWDYPIGENDTTPNKVTGLYVSIADRFDPTNWYKTVVRPGFFTKLDLAATHIQLINLERGALIQPCVENGVDLYKIFNTSYSRTACQMDCLLAAYYETCQCIIMMDRSILKQNLSESAPFCDINKAQKCVKNEVLNSKVKMDAVEKCKNDCNTPCDSIRYDMRSSYAELTDHIRHDLLGSDKFNGSVKTKDLIRLDIAFRRMEFAEMIQSESKTVAILISDMGGTMNFWLGASLIALIEMITMLIGTFCYLCLRKYR